MRDDSLQDFILSKRYIAEGAVQAKMKNGNILDAVFCDVFLMDNGKIKMLTSYLMSKNASLKLK